MKIKATLTIEIDPADWTLTFGVEGAAAIREDVKAYIAENVGFGALSNGEVPSTITVT